MKNIDSQLNEWVIQKIKKEYSEDIALLIGHKGGCKIPTDEQNVVFDFFVPLTKRGNQLAKTFIIEDMGYDLYPNSWERLKNIVDLKEPRMIFAFAKGEILYAKDTKEEECYRQLRERLAANLADKVYTYHMSLEHINTAMEIFQTMIFEESMSHVRKAAGGIANFLMTAIAFVNGTYLKNGYSNLTLEMKEIAQMPEGFEDAYHKMIHATALEEIKKFSYQMLATTRKFFHERKPVDSLEDISCNMDDLANWYHEARYSFRRVQYYCDQNSVEEVFQLGCYLQIEFDAIKAEFGLMEMDILGVFDSKNLNAFKERAKELEDYIKDTLQKNNANMNIYASLEEFLKVEG